MNVMLAVLLSTSLFILLTPPILAQETTPAQIRYTNEFTVANEPSSVITLLKNFITGFDSILGGFIFHTPDPLADTIVLKDDSQITGLTKYRNIFYQITIPIIAIIISAIAINKIGSESAYELKTFSTRLITVVALFIIVPTALSYSIQANNLLINRITETPEFTGFLNDYFDKTQEALAKNEESEKFGIPSFKVSNEGGVFRSLGKFIVEIFLFAITFVFLLCGFLYIGYQFVIRFATLLFLGVIYPIVLPFALYERTQGIVQSFFKTWFTFLIQQPAFVLGYSITTDIFSSLLNAQGPSVGLLFFYTGFLFFLGGVNMLVAKIFGDTWSAMSTNFTAAYAAGSMSSPIKNSVNDFKRGLGVKSMGTMLGNKTSQRIAPKSTAEASESIDKFIPSSPNSKYIKYKHNSSIPYFSMQLSQKGFQVQQENPSQGTVSLSGNAYKYQDNRTGLTTYYPSMNEATQDGIPDSKLQPVELAKATFIDLSHFNKTNPNPHSFNALQEARKQGKPVNHGYVTKSSPPNKVKNFLELSHNRNQAMGIQGVIVSRQAQEGSGSIIRLYSHKDYEKHPNL